MNRIRASFERMAHNAGPIAVIGGFLLLVVLVFGVFKIVALAQAQSENSKNGRAIVKQVQEQTQTIKDQTDPNSKVSKQRADALNGILSQLFDSFIVGQNDGLRRFGEMLEQCRALPCSPMIINRILAEPAPMVTFTAGVPMTSTTTKPSASPVSVPRVVTPMSPTPAPSMPISVPSPTTSFCPATQVAPLNLLRICIPP